MKILTSEEMGETDRRTEADFGVPLGELMEHAGVAVAKFCLRKYGTERQTVVLCGKGNNGGDGLVAARQLASRDHEVRVILLGKESEMRAEAAWALERLRKESPRVGVIVLEDDEVNIAAQEALAHADLIIDAIVGTGFKPPLRGVAASLREVVAALDTQVVAVDLPSGWDADATTQHADGTEGEGTEREPTAFRADAVVTFTAPKLAHVLGHLTPGRTFGPVVVAEIGSPAAAVQSKRGLTWTGASKVLTERPRDINANKGKFGHVLLVGGSYGKAGAPSMSSLAALRTGAGLVTAAVPESILNTVALVTPELMMAPLEQGSGGAATLANLQPAKLEALMKGIKVLAIGPGLSTEGEASEFARTMVERTTVPVVIDADALNAFAGRAELLKGVSGKGMGEDKERTVVLTPHPGEMARLLGTTVQEVEADRLGIARAFATEHGVTLVLKGWRTLVAHPDGRMAVNTSGNPGMAKGGSGDILTGIVAAMLAQYPGEVTRAVEAAVYLHGLAADFAVHWREEHTLLATDTVDHLSDAFEYRARDEDGLTWICGINEER